jgi:HK97 family phage major capsid protein
MHIRHIQSRREEIRTAMHALLDREEGDLTAEERASIDVMEGELPALDEAERRQKVLNALDLAAIGKPLNGAASSGRLEVRAFEGASSPTPESFDGVVLRAQDGSRVPVLEHRHRLASFLPPSESRAGELGLGGFLRSLHGGPQSELERRVLAEAAVGTGGAFVPTVLSAEVIDLLRARSVAFAAGARTVPMTSQTLKFARVLSDPIGAWRNENAAIAVSDPGFDALTLIARSWALVCLISRELLEDGTNVDATLRNTFANAAALALDHAILYGTGTPPEPRGIVNTSGIQTVSMGTNGANFSTYGGAGGIYSGILDATLALDNADAGTLSAMIMAPRTSRYLNGIVDATGQPMVMPARIANVPKLVTTSMPINETQGTSSLGSSVLLGDFSEAYVGMRTALQVSVLSERYADVGQVGFVLWLRADVAVARPAALARIVGIIP